MKKLRIIFMGTPEFAVPSLEKIVNAHYNVVAVVTAPDKPSGRGLQLNESAIKKFALSNNLKILQPEKLKNENFINELMALHADLQIVVAFRMLPEIVWNMPSMGTINLHGSLLPQYRGAAPINWAIINGEKETGVTTFKLKHNIDTGNILLQQYIAIGDAETAGELHDKMMEVGANLLLETLQKLEANQLEEIPQNMSQTTTDSNGELHHAPKLFTEDCQINWEKDVNDIFNLIRGLSPYPAAHSFLNNKKVKIFLAEKEVSDVQHLAGTVVSDRKSFLKFACTNGYISVIELQAEGKKKMSIKDFLLGWRQ